MHYSIFTVFSEKDMELAGMKKLVKSGATIKTNLGTSKPIGPKAFPSWETVSKCKLFPDLDWAQFASNLVKMMDPQPTSVNADA